MNNLQEEETLCEPRILWSNASATADGMRGVALTPRETVAEQGGGGGAGGVEIWREESSSHMQTLY